MHHSTFTKLKVETRKNEENDFHQFWHWLVPGDASQIGTPAGRKAPAGVVLLDFNISLFLP